MDILRDGTFSFEINTQELARGLRPSRYNPRNMKFLTECKGAISRDGVLQTVPDLTDLNLDTSIITDGFPYPQVFVFEKVIIVCGETKIYTYDGTTLTLEATVTAGLPWNAVEFSNFVYMSNGAVSVFRSAADKDFTITTDVPTARAICNFNGQVLIGAPDVEM